MPTATDFELLDALAELSHLNITTSIAADTFTQWQHQREALERSIAQARAFAQRQGFPQIEAALNVLAARLP